MTDDEIAAALALAEKVIGFHPETSGSDVCVEHDRASHWPCEEVDLAKATESRAADLQWARGFIAESTGQTVDELRLTEARMTERCSGRMIDEDLALCGDPTCESPSCRQSAVDRWNEAQGQVVREVVQALIAEHGQALQR